MGSFAVVSTARSANGSIVRYHGLACETNAQTRGVACVRADSRGFIVFAGATQVLVSTNKYRVVYSKLNAYGGKATHFPFAGQKLVDFGDVRCKAKLPARVACARSDGIGFGVVITKSYVAVVRLVDGKRIFYRANS